MATMKNVTRRMMTSIVSPVSMTFFVTYVIAVMMTSYAKSMVIGPERYDDKPFPPRLMVYNQTVTCGETSPGRFIAPTFTCADIKVNGHKLAYGYYSGWAIGMEKRRCQETSGVHEFGQLCLTLLQSIHQDKLGLRAVYIPNSTCGYLNETRKLLKKVAKDKFEWRDFGPGWGWTSTIQCMTSS